MRSRADLGCWRTARIGLLAVLVPTLAAAQSPLDTESPLTRLRDRYRAPENSQKLSDSVHKLNGDDPEQRLDAIRTLGELKDQKATEYLVGAANDPDMRVRIKAIDTLGQIKAKE